MDVKILENRLIAFLDVLGFTAFLQNESLIKVHEKYSEFIDIAKNTVFFKTEGDNTGRTNFEYAQFVSDSIILVSNPIDDVYNINNFIAAVSFLLEIGFTSKLPLRGAITKGNFLIDNIRDIFISKEFAELVHFEGSQEWSGCAILKSAEEIIIESIFGKIDKNMLMQKQIGNNLVLSYNVPLKNGSSETLFIINYLVFMTKDKIIEGIDHLIEPKKSNNKKYFEYLNSLPFEYQSLQPEFLPAVTLLMVKTRSGFRVAFLDDQGNPCKPGVDKIMWEAHGRWRE